MIGPLGRQERLGSRKRRSVHATEEMLRMEVDGGLTPTRWAGGWGLGAGGIGTEVRRWGWGKRQ